METPPASGGDLAGDFSSELASRTSSGVHSWHRGVSLPGCRARHWAEPLLMREEE
jgi:hypothetical protein